MVMKHQRIHDQNEKQAKYHGVFRAENESQESGGEITSCQHHFGTWHAQFTHHTQHNMQKKRQHVREQEWDGEKHKETGKAMETQGKAATKQDDANTAAPQHGQEHQKRRRRS